MSFGAFLLGVVAAASLVTCRAKQSAADPLARFDPVTRARLVELRHSMEPHFAQ